MHINFIPSGARLTLLLVLYVAGPASLLAQPYLHVATPRASDGSLGDQFGLRLALSNGRLVVGTWFDDHACPTNVNCNSGSVYVFEENHGGPGAWGEVTVIRASDEAEEALFGYSLDLESDTLVIGAYADDEAGPEAGAVYVFKRLGSAWTEEAKILPPDLPMRLFGTDVALAADILVVGSPADPYLCPMIPSTCLAGSTYIFARHQGGPNQWGLVKKVVPSDAQPQHIFGHSVDISGDTIIVAAYGDGDNAGAVYAFDRDEGGQNNWGETQKLVASDRERDDIMGRWPDTVAIDHDTIVAGAPFDDDGCVPSTIGCNSGSAYVFVRSGGTWSEEQKLTASDEFEDAVFGNAVAVDGRRIAVGATWLYENSGFVYLFERGPGGAWSEVEKLTPADHTGGSWGFGAALDLDWSLLAVGAFLADHACPADPFCDSGATYLYLQTLFGDGFESGDTSAWSAVVGR